MTIERIEIHDAAAIALLKSEPVMQDLLRRAKGIQREATSNMLGAVAASGNKLAILSALTEKDPFRITDKITPTRDHVIVETATYAARAAESTGRSLTSALDAGRG
jgi:hypothetical protein